MHEAAAVGLLPHLFWDYTPREVYACIKGSAIYLRRVEAKMIYAAWHTAVWGRVKKIKPLDQVMKAYQPKSGPMSTSGIRSVIMGIASALGAKVTRIKKE